MFLDPADRGLMIYYISVNKITLMFCFWITWKKYLCTIDSWECFPTSDDWSSYHHLSGYTDAKGQHINNTSVITACWLEIPLIQSMVYNLTTNFQLALKEAIYSWIKTILPWFHFQFLSFIVNIYVLQTRKQKEKNNLIMFIFLIMKVEGSHRIDTKLWIYFIILHMQMI